MIDLFFIPNFKKIEEYLFFCDQFGPKGATVLKSEIYPSNFGVW